MRLDLDQTPEGMGDEPRIMLPKNVLEFLAQKPTPPSYNGYKCERRSKHNIITIDIHPGVTPMLVRCKEDHCDAWMTSFGYPNNGEGPVPTHYRHYPLWLWYRPSMGEFLNLEPQVTDHVMQGGLLMRPAGVTLDEWEAAREAKQ